MILISDTREALPLVFSKIEGVEYRTEGLSVGDYTARYKDGKMSDTIWERKSLPDIFLSFTGKNYERERKKMLRYKECGFEKYILAIEATVFEIRTGYHYRKDGQEHWAKKDGLSMIRQIMTCMRKYGIIPWFFSSKEEMAFTIQEYFLTYERVKV